MAHTKFGKWVAEVRDPAERSTEGERSLSHGRAEAIYSIASIPGGWAWKAEATAGYSSSSTPWRDPLPTRAEALAAALSFLREKMREYSDAAKDGYAAPGDARKVLDDLTDGLFGFIEPDPLTANARVQGPQL